MYRWRHHSVPVVSVYCGTYVICIGTLPASIAMEKRLSPPIGAASGYVVRPLGRCRSWEHAACMVTTTDARHKPHRIYTHKGINAQAIHRFEPATSSDVGWGNGAGSRRLRHQTVELPDLDGRSPHSSDNADATTIVLGNRLQCVRQADAVRWHRNARCYRMTQDMSL